MRLVLIFLLFLGFLPAVAQLRCDSLVVDAIFISGNRRTKEHILKRELAFTDGSRLALADTARIFSQGRNLVFNTRLFVYVRLTVIPMSADTTYCPRPVVVHLEVKERLYVFPLPILELADRSINEWLYNQGGRLSRVNYGARLDLNNVRGRNETARLILQGGFTRKVEVSYGMPYFTRNLKHGVGANVLYATNKSVAARSLENRQDFVRAFGPTLGERFRTTLGYSHRANFYAYHSMQFEFNHNQIEDTVARLNPEYFLHGRSRQRFFALKYDFNFDKRDIRQYPLTGQLFRASAERLGLFAGDEIDLTTLRASYSKYLPWGGRFYSAHNVAGTYSFPKRQPYAQTNFLGFAQNFVRGYEKYVMEGYTNLVFKNTLRYRLLSFSMDVPAMPLTQFRFIPISIYLKTFADAGYVNNPFALPENRRLINTWLAGAGVGIDVVTFYDYVLRFEYSLNRHGERGLFFHVGVEI